MDWVVRGIGLVYVIAYIPFLTQAKGLWGKRGLLPAELFLQAAKKSYGFWKLPTVFWLRADDKALLVMVWWGILLGTLLFLGFSPTLLLALLYFTHLSWISIGQDFMSFGWETYLLEITVALFLSSTPNFMGWLATNVLLFRFFFQAGITKLMSGDKTWRNLTALSYHYLTQPIPNPVSWFIYHAPKSFHRFSTAFALYAEIVVPFMIFIPELRLFAFLQLLLLQLGIGLTGNFSFLTLMTALFCAILLVPMPETPVWDGPISFFALLYLILQLLNLIKTFFYVPLIEKLHRVLFPYHLAYVHAIFSIMTTKRVEIVLEGSLDGIMWHEYLFKYKPGPLSRLPAQIAPFQPRLDWQAWFLPFQPFAHQRWLHHFAYRLLQAEPEVLKLLAHDPFLGQKPKVLRGLAYDYEYTTPAERKATGNWWKRKLMGVYFEPMSG